MKVLKPKVLAQANFLYLQLLQSIAGLIVGIINADQDKDGEIEIAEILSVLTPLLLNAILLKNQFQAFVAHFSQYDIGKVRTDLNNLIQLQLLPDQYSGAETKIDLFLDGVLDLFTGAQKVQKTFNKPKA